MRDTFWCVQLDAPAVALLIACILSALSSCAPIRGFPDDPAADSALSTYSITDRNGASVTIQVYGPASEVDYDATTDETMLLFIRNRLVRKRLYGYDVEYSAFKRRMASDANVVSAGGSIAALIVGGLGATTGNGAAASALAAAGAGIVGAQGVVNRDLYFQKTLPALLAQMDAARDRTLAAILQGLREPVAVYSLADANVDLQRLKDAGSIESAIATINQDAANAKSDAQNKIIGQVEYINSRESRQTVRQRIDSLTAAQVTGLANAMAPQLNTASEDAQRAARQYLRPGGTFAANQSTAARQFVTQWIGFETMTPDWVKQWNSAIDAAVK